MKTERTIWVKYKHLWHALAFIIFMKLAGAYNPKIKPATPLPKRTETVLACG